VRHFSLYIVLCFTSWRISHSRCPFHVDHFPESHTHFGPSPLRSLPISVLAHFGLYHTHFSPKIWVRSGHGPKSVGTEVGIEPLLSTTELYNRVFTSDVTYQPETVRHLGSIRKEEEDSTHWFFCDELTVRFGPRVMHWLCMYLLCGVVIHGTVWHIAHFQTITNKW